MVRDSTGEVVLAGVTQDEGFLSPEVEESRACMFDLKTAAAHGFKRLVVEGDSLAFTTKLKKGDRLNSLVGYFIQKSLVSVQFLILYLGTSLKGAVIRLLMQSPISILSTFVIWQLRICVLT